MSEVTKACSPAPAPPKSDNGSRAVLSTKLWPINEELRYCFLDGAGTKRAKAVKDTIEIWSKYANISFEHTTKQAEAHIKISFQSPGGASWSTVGTDAKAYKDLPKATLNLGWIENEDPPSAEDKATILHEFGHALGMMHEHQSPARGERIHLNEAAVYAYYRPLLGYNDGLVKTQVIDQYNQTDVYNYSRLDLQSIMMYFMPASLNQERIEVPPNLELSSLDKAFITLTYPRTDKAAKAKGGLTVKEALKSAGVPADVADKILKPLKVVMDANPDAGTDADKDHATTKTALNSVRKGFHDYNVSVMRLATVNQAYVKPGSGDGGGQFGIRDIVGGVIKNPMVQGIIKQVVSEVFAQRGIPTVTSTPGSTQSDVLDTIRIIATNPAFEKAISDMNSTLSGDPAKAAAKAEAKAKAKADSRVQRTIKQTVKKGFEEFSGTVTEPAEASAVAAVESEDESDESESEDEGDQAVTAVPSAKSNQAGDPDKTNQASADISEKAYDALASAFLTPQFREIVTNLAISDLPNHVTLSSYPVQPSVDVQQGIIPVILPLLMQLGALFSIPGQSGLQAHGLQANSTDPLPPNVQQGVFNILTDFVQNPIFKHVVTNIVAEVARNAAA